MDEDNKSGNLTGLYIAEEDTPGKLPATPVWIEREPNSYSDFGGAYETTTRTHISHDRQTGRGEISDNNPTGGFAEDFTPTNMVDLMQGFLFADAREKPTTAPLNGAAVVVTSTTANQFHAANGLDRFKLGDIILVEGFGDENNNGINVVTAAGAAAVTVASPLEVEADAPDGARLTVVGREFAAGDLTIAVTDSHVILTSAAVDMTTLGLTPGEFIVVGGDDAVTRFADAGDNAPFYGRVDIIEDDRVMLDKTTGVQVTNNGAGKSIQVFFGTVIRNEADCTLIKKRTYTLERQYGCGDDAEAEYVGGAAANQLTITVPTPGGDAKVTTSLAFIASTSYERTAEEGVLAGTRIAALNEPVFKPGLDVYQHRLAVVDGVTLNPTPLVGYNSEATITITNNLAGNKAIEVFGNASINVGTFGVSGSMTSYFPGVIAARRVRQGADLTWHLIMTKANKAVVLDMDSVGVGNARATVEANAPVRLPLDLGAGKGKHGYTLLATFMRYAPAAVMATTRPNV